MSCTDTRAVQTFHLSVGRPGKQGCQDLPSARFHKLICRENPNIHYRGLSPINGDSRLAALPKGGIALVKAVLLHLVNTVVSQQSHSHEDLQAQEYIKSCTVAGNDGDQDTSPSHQSMGFCLVTEQFERNTGKAGAAAQLVEHLPTN